MKEYHKIQTLYERDPATNLRTVTDKFARPEFALLSNLSWHGTEKIDGTNIRVMWDGSQARFGGKTENAQIPARLVSRLQDMFLVDLLLSVFGADTRTTLYGEGYGAKIQKGGGDYIADGCSFILFDVQIHDCGDHEDQSLWLSRTNVSDIGERLSLKEVPDLGSCDLFAWTEMVKNGFKSAISENPEKMAEGVVLRLDPDLLDRQGRRIIAKLKTKDYPVSQ